MGKRFDAYLEENLVWNPCWDKMATFLESECTKFVKNYTEFIRKEGREGERSADLIRRLGEDLLTEGESRSNKSVWNGALSAIQSRKTK
jgi:hypothetical protein